MYLQRRQEPALVGVASTPFKNSLEIFSAALHYLGLPTQGSSVEQITKAQNLFSNIESCVTYFDSNKYVADLAAGRICCRGLFRQRKVEQFRRKAFPRV